MPKNLYVAAAIIVAISMSVDSIAQVTTCSVRRRVSAKVWRISDSGEIFDRVEDGDTNRDLGDFAFTAEAAVVGASSSASHSMNWVFGDGVVAATGAHLLEISQSEEGVHRGFSTSVMVDGYFTTTSNTEISYSGVAVGGFAHVIQIERGDGFLLEGRFPVSGGEFSYTSPVLEPGEYQLFIALVDNYDGSDAFSREASSDFGLTITLSDGVEVENNAWGMVKALYN